VTDKEGKFTFNDLDSSLKFRLLAVADNYTPKYSNDFIATNVKEASIALNSNSLDKKPGRLILSGVVKGQNGQVIRGAVVRPFGMKVGTRQYFGGRMPIDSLAVTNEEGKFRLGLEKPAVVDVIVSSRGQCTKHFKKLETNKPNILELEAGVTIQGYVKQAGKASEGIEMGLVQQDRSPRNFIGDFAVATDKNGFFQFVNVPANEKFYVYGHSKSLKKRGCIKAKAISTKESGSVMKLNKPLLITSGYDLSGRIILSDGKKIPAELRVSLIRQKAWD